MPGIPRKNRKGVLMTEVHPKFRINKAWRKQFLMLSPKEYLAKYKWFLIQLIGMIPYRMPSPPKIRCDSELMRAWHKHANDLIKIYAPKVRLHCRHMSRTAYCERCALDIVLAAQKQLDEIRNRRRK